MEGCMDNVHPISHIKVCCSPTIVTRNGFTDESEVLELMIKREPQKDPELVNKNWDRFLPQFKKRTLSKRKKPRNITDKFKKPYTVRPILPSVFITIRFLTVTSHYLLPLKNQRSTFRSSPESISSRKSVRSVPPEKSASKSRKRTGTRRREKERKTLFPLLKKATRKTIRRKGTKGKRKRNEGLGRRKKGRGLWKQRTEQMRMGGRYGLMNCILRV